MTRLYFGTDGIRGPYGGPVMNEAFAARVGAAAGRWLRKGAGAANAQIPIGWDTRHSGESLARAVAAGLSSEGFCPALLGVLPTPAVCRAVLVSGAPAGVIVTASHNPATDNGIKFFAAGGRKLADTDEAEIEDMLPPEAGLAKSGFTESAKPPTSYLEGYVAAMTKLLLPGALRGWRVVLDTANGATCATTPVVLRALGASVIEIGNQPDGRNINEGVGSEHAEALAKRVASEGARMGIAHDGDGDRCVLCDEAGGILDGDEILAILATHALSAGGLRRGVVVATIQSSLGLDAAVAAAGGRVVRTPVGDRHVAERMAAEGAELGGESSGHVIFSDLLPAADGLAAALKVIEVMLATGRPLSELRRCMAKIPRKTAGIEVREKRPLAELRGLSSAMGALESELGARGRVVVRYSGTEPKLRLLVEGPDEETVRMGLDRLVAAAQTDLAVRP